MTSQIIRGLRISSANLPQILCSLLLSSQPVSTLWKTVWLIPRKSEDLGDCGAFPEIHVAQYPLGIGRKDEKLGSKILPLTVDSQGNVASDAIVKQNENALKFVCLQRYLVPNVALKEVEESEDLQKEIEENTQRTKSALEKIVNERLSTAQPKNVPTQTQDSKYII